MKIAKVHGREIYDGSARPTIECEITLEDGSYVTSSVAAASTPSDNEMAELRDGGSRVLGFGVSTAIENIESLIAPALVGKEPNLVEMDMELIELDGTADKSKLGANAMLATSIAVLRAQAAIEGMQDYELIGYLCEYSSITLPFALFNYINGGVVAPGNLRLQEIMAIPIGMDSFRSCMEAAATLYHLLYQLLKKKCEYVGLGAYGAFNGCFKDDAHALDLMMECMEYLQRTYGYRFLLSINTGASHFYNARENLYDWNSKQVTSDELIDLYVRLTKHYPLFAIEDGLSHKDHAGWIAMTQALKDKIQVIGDDIFASSPHAIAKALEQGYGTGVLIKPNQIGTLTEVLQSIKLAREYEMACIIAGRGHETNDTIIVDLAVGTSTGYIKAGAPAGGEHVAKYNELLRIEDSLMLSLMQE